MSGGKTKLIFFNCEGNDFEHPSRNGDICQVIKQQNLSEYLSIASATTGVLLLKQLKEQTEIGT